MSRFPDRARDRQLRLREELRAKYPALAGRPPAPLPSDRTAIVPGRHEGGGPLVLPLGARLEHMQVIGTTGAGKTKFLEHCIRQDIIDGRGVCVVDPHGNHPDSLYRSLLCWMERRGFTASRTVHLIDPNAGTHITGLNPLARPTPDYDFSVVAEAMQEALERLWGEEDMNTKPTMQRVLSALLAALAELNLTLTEARLLFDPADSHGVRAWAIRTLANIDAKEELEWLDAIASGQRGAQDFRAEITGPRNRIAKLTRNDAIRAMVGQQESGIDFSAALDNGHIILANLAPGPRVSDKAAQLLGRLLTRMLFFHCTRRRNPREAFFFYLDECQLYLSGDVSRFLAESRKYGVGVVLSSQYRAQYEAAGADILEAVKNATNIKAVFRIKDADEAAALADLVFRYDLEAPVQALVKPTVVGHRIRRLASESVSDQFAVSEMQSETHGEAVSETHGYSHSVADMTGESVSESESESVQSAVSASESQSSGSASGWEVSTMMGPQTSAFGAPTIVGMSQGMNGQTQRAASTGTQTSRGESAGHSRGQSSSHSHSVSTTESESVSTTVSHARTVGRGETRGKAHTAGSQEAFEPIYEERPSAVHSLENIRHMAGHALRSLTAGRAAISFVDAGGLKSMSLSVARVESDALPEEDFAALRTRVFEASPSAVPYEAALRHIAERERAVIEQAKGRPADPDSPTAYRTRKARPPKRNAPPNANGHGRAGNGVQ